MQMQLLHLASTISLWPDRVNTGWRNGSQRGRRSGTQKGRICLCEGTASKCTVNTENIPCARAASANLFGKIWIGEIGLSQHENFWLWVSLAVVIKFSDAVFSPMSIQICTLDCLWKSSIYKRQSVDTSDNLHLLCWRGVVVSCSCKDQLESWLVCPLLVFSWSVQHFSFYFIDIRR